MASSRYLRAASEDRSLSFPSTLRPSCQLFPQPVDDELAEAFVPVLLGELVPRQILAQLGRHLQHGKEGLEDVVGPNDVQEPRAEVVGALRVGLPEIAMVLEELDQAHVLQRLLLGRVQRHRYTPTAWRLVTTPTTNTRPSWTKKSQIVQWYTPLFCPYASQTTPSATVTRLTRKAATETPAIHR